MIRVVSRRQALGITLGALLGATAYPGIRLTQGTVTGHSQTQQSTQSLYIGAYHWGFVLLDDSGTELQQVSVRTDTRLRLTAFSVEASEAVAALPEAVRGGLPNHETLEERNLSTIPVPSGVNLASLLEHAERNYPDHGVAIVPDEWVGGMGSGSGWGHHGPGWGHHGGGQWDGYGPGRRTGPGPHGPGWPGHQGGMVAPPLTLWHHATTPTVLEFVVTVPGPFTVVCPTYCGYGHSYMVAPSALVVSSP
ncbi:hypothetical protein [Halomarina litorea]|uniref:hypothetical protein n=1 Tax=Halomarina litorea TaxID=2961595 RepID=UPI0020C2BBA4|nr:hypothetical protein [Halomarina sp. BCD28]